MPSVATSFYKVTDSTEGDGLYGPMVISPISIIPTLAASEFYRNGYLDETEGLTSALDIGRVLFTLPTLLLASPTAVSEGSQNILVDS